LPGISLVEYLGSRLIDSTMQVTSFNLCGKRLLWSREASHNALFYRSRWNRVLAHLFLSCRMLRTISPYYRCHSWDSELPVQYCEEVFRTLCRTPGICSRKSALLPCLLSNLYYMRQPTSQTHASGRAARSATLTRRTHSERRENPPWMLSPTLGTLYLTITIPYVAELFKLLTTFHTFIFIDWHGSLLPLTLRLAIFSLPASAFNFSRNPSFQISRSLSSLCLPLPPKRPYKNLSFPSTGTSSLL